MKLALVVLSFALFLAAIPAHAEALLLDADRFAAGAGVSYDWHGGNPQPAPPHGSEIAANAFGSYVLTQHFSAAGRFAYGAANGTLRASPGLHYRVAAGKERVALALSYDFYAGDFNPAFANEWVVSAIYSRPLGEYLTLSVVEGWGFDNHEARTSVQATAPLWAGKEK